MTVKSSAVLCLLNRLLPVSCVFLALFPICNFAFINICLYTICLKVKWFIFCWVIQQYRTELKFIMDTCEVWQQCSNTFIFVSDEVCVVCFRGRTHWSRPDQTRWPAWLFRTLMTDVNGSVATAWDMARHDEPSLVLSGAWLFLCHPLPVTRGVEQEIWPVLTLNVCCSLPLLLFCHFNVNLLQLKCTVTVVWTTVNLTENCYTTIHNSME